LDKEFNMIRLVPNKEQINYLLTYIYIKYIYIYMYIHIYTKPFRAIFGDFKNFVAGEEPTTEDQTCSRVYNQYRKPVDR
jgi:hypothetical protein